MCEVFIYFDPNVFWKYFVALDLKYRI